MTTTTTTVTKTATTDTQPHIYALISYDQASDSYTQPLILSALESKLPRDSYTLITDDAEIDSFLESVDEAGKGMGMGKGGVGYGVGGVKIRARRGRSRSMSRSRNRRSRSRSKSRIRHRNGSNNSSGGSNGKIKPSNPPVQILQIRGYEKIDFELAHTWAVGVESEMTRLGDDGGIGEGKESFSLNGNRDRTVSRRCLVNAYMIRKALIRKHFLARCVEIAAVKGKHRDGGRKRDGEMDREGMVIDDGKDNRDYSQTDDGEGFWSQNQHQHQQFKKKTNYKEVPFRLQDHFPVTVDFELDYAEFLDEALVEAYELKRSFEKNEVISAKTGSEFIDDIAQDERDWWILKPGMGDGGQGIRLFSSEEELKAIFEEWEEDEEEEEEDEKEEIEDTDDGKNNDISEKRTGDDIPVTGDAIGDDNSLKDEKTSIFNSNGIITSQLRHFVAQQYIKDPLLFPNLPNLSNHKFHIRTYVIAFGSLKVYVYKPMLALFAQNRYEKPGSINSTNNLAAHLTNTCLSPSAGALAGVEPKIPGNASDIFTREEPETDKQRVKLFWDLPDTIPDSAEKQRSTQSLEKTTSSPVSNATRATTPDDWKNNVFAQICAITGTVFEAAAREMMVHFQTMPNAFEIFGIDFLLDKDGHAWLLEVNAFPDFKQTGEELKHVIAGLYESVVDVAIKPFFGMTSVRIENDHDDDDVINDNSNFENADIKCVLDIDLGRR